MGNHSLLPCHDSHHSYGESALRLCALSLQAPLRLQCPPLFVGDNGVPRRGSHDSKLPAFERVGRYVNHGASLLLDKNKRINVLGSGAEKILGSGASIAKMLIKTHPLGRVGLPIIEGISETIVENFSEKLANKQDSDNSIDEQSLVIQEVEADLQAFEHYLLHGIFAAAGFQAFCLQELESLKDNFLKDACSWDAVARNEWEKGNDLLLKELPAELQKQEFDTLVSDKLKQLGISLGKVKPSLY